jgi:hypothetical protein
MLRRRIFKNKCKPSCESSAQLRNDELFGFFENRTTGSRISFDVFYDDAAPID